MFMNLAAMALLHPLFVEEGGLFDEKHVKIATLFEVSSPAQLENLQPLSDQEENMVVNLLDWQVLQISFSFVCFFFLNDMIGLMNSVVMFILKLSFCICVAHLLVFQVIPAENIVAAIQGTRKTVFAISKTPSEAQLFLEV